MNAIEFHPAQMMLEDRYFYDLVAGSYTVDRYLDDLEKRYGGIDAVLIWHANTQKLRKGGRLELLCWEYIRDVSDFVARWLQVGPQPTL
jgi:hypothetical protein